MKIQRNAWESEFFGREIYSLSIEQKDISDQVPLFSKEGLGEICKKESNLIKELAKREKSSFKQNQKADFVIPDCQISPSPSLLKRGTHFESQKGFLLQTKIPTTALDKLAYLQQNGFTLVETEITFSLDLANFNENLTACNTRLATEQELPTLKNLVAKAFPNTRFREPYFSQAENQRFYQQWIENAVKGEFDDLCLIAGQQGEWQGAISLRFLSGKAKIGLLAVSPEFQRQGIGKGLLFAAILQAKAHNAKRLEITTQLSNIPAIRLYQAFGAKITEMNYWVYK